MTAKSYKDKYGRYIKFIKKYCEASNASTGSEVDSNANVDNKNVTTCTGELYKRDAIGINRLQMINKITELYGEDLAEEYIRQLDSHEIYRHDETNPLLPYTFASQEVINVKYCNKIYSVTFEQLYDMVDKPEELLDEEREVYAKYPEGLEIEDKNGWTIVHRLIRKRRHRDLVRVKTAFGNDIVVTDNHPMIVNDNINDTVPAEESLGQLQFRSSSKGKITFGGQTEISVEEVVNKCKLPFANYESFFCYKASEASTWMVSPAKIKVDRDLGYLVGFFIGDGDYNNETWTVGFTQKDKEPLVRIGNIIYSHFNSPFYINYDFTSDKYRLYVRNPLIYCVLKHIFGILPYSNHRTLPKDVFSYTREFAVGLIEGLIDSDGTIRDGKAYEIALSSRAAILQIANIISALGLPTSLTTQQTKFGTNNKIQQKYQIFRVRFCEYEDAHIFTNSLKHSRITGVSKGRKANSDGWATITNVEKIDNEPFLDMNEFIYDITTQSHTFVCNGLWVHNCVSITMYPYLFHGTTNIGGNSEAPKHLDSFCGSFINLVYAVASQFAGAIATPEFLMYMDYFIRKDYGDDYYLHPEQIVSMGVNPKSLENLIENKFQQVVYTINDPAGSRNFQSVFWNIAYFDHAYFKGIFEDFVFPDGTEPKWESTNWLQKKFMKWFNKERLKKILTFPVETVNLLNNGEDCDDTEWRDFAAEMWSEGASFFCYTSDSVDALASCCYGADTKVLVRRSGKVVLATLKEISSWKTKNNLYVLSNGEWKKAKFVELPNERTMYRVEFKNGSSLVMTDNHRNNCVDGMKYTKNLKIGDYVEVASKPIETDGTKLNEILSRIDDEDRMFALRAMIGSIDSYDLVNEDKRYTKVVRISIVEYNEPFVYCFEMEDKENDKFTLANGIHNYNCRLKNTIQSNVFSYTLGAGGLMTGSKGVITININRLVQNVAKEHGGKENITLNDISVRISEQVSKLHKYMTAYNEILKDYYNARMLPVYDAGYISLEKQYLTMGINGFVEGAEFLGIEPTPNDDYFAYGEAILKPIFDLNRQDRTEEIMFNTEFVPKVCGDLVA